MSQNRSITRNRRERGILTIAKKAGYKTFWLSNQNATDGLLTLIAEGADVRHFYNHGDVISESPYDDILLKPYKEALDDPAPLKLIVVHLLGSHFHYKFRYPEKYSRFNSNNDQVACEMRKTGRPEWMIEKRNEYDNSILFTDAVCSQLAQGLFSPVDGKTSGKGAALLYFSDHGQEVGHYRDHGGPSKSDKSGWEVPMVLMTSESLAIPKPELEKRAFQTDRLESTLLGLLKIETPFYMASDDILSRGFTAKDRSMEDSPYSAEKH